MEQTHADKIIAAVKDIVTGLAPEARYIAKYGGEVIAPVPADETHVIGGVFTSAQHVSLEFSQGARFDDPKGCLEGSGKLRRHIKLRSVDDVAAKHVEEFLQQALRAP